IVGRRSIDIIKSGGYKLSALEIEEVLRDYELVIDCAVVGIPDEEWGEIVAAALVIEGNHLDEKKLRAWASERLPGYKTPWLIKVVSELPRNAMGKVVKMEVKELMNPTK
ncbi:MAG: long-chain fatty acid--CoA ligase, partial [Bacteroidetes bacterium]|nr:long-chain fatty acid--CoA ligase [Bacteroidota bacterium]